MLIGSTPSCVSVSAFSFSGLRDGECAIGWISSVSLSLVEMLLSSNSYLIKQMSVIPHRAKVRKFSELLESYRTIGTGDGLMDAGVAYVRRIELILVDDSWLVVLVSVFDSV